MTFSPRDRTELHREEAPLELLFDLVSIITVESDSEIFHRGIFSGSDTKRNSALR